jgi:glucose/mannose-6-phosphate isomerase
MNVDLNDREVVGALDPDGILALTEGFGAQCREALELARSVTLRPLQGLPRVVAQVGMGGSAAGGDFGKALFEAHGAAPFVVVRDAQVPSFVGLGDLCFCVSYSGDTEETLRAYDSARRAGARVIAVTSGGELRRRAERDGVEVFIVPGGRPPRTALGYLFVPVIVACESFRLIPEQMYEKAFALLDDGAALWGIEAKDNEAKALARAMHGKLPILYGLGGWPAVVANRWRSQINENAKQLAFANAYPELDHNEIMGWVGASLEMFAGVRLEGSSPEPPLRARAQATEELIGLSFARVAARGETLLAQMLSLVYLGDWVSLYLARLNGVDPADIGWIDRLKEKLAE